MNSMPSHSLRLARNLRRGGLALFVLLVLGLGWSPTRLQAEQPVTVQTIVSSSGRQWNAPPSTQHFFGSFAPARLPRKTAVYPAVVVSPFLLREDISPSSVIGPDNRVQITNTLQFPYLPIVYLQLFFDAGIYEECSGWLVAPRLVATAGHCVNDPGLGWAHGAVVYAGLNQNTAAGVARSVDFFTVKGWVESREPEFDYGAILLDSDLGDSTGWIGMAALTDSELQQITVRITGYPADKAPDTMWTMSGPLKRITPLRLFYDVDTYAGQSGSPVYNNNFSRACLYCVVAIHGYGVGGDPRGTSNSGVRITQPVLNNYLSWRKLAP